ncbi:hypothetical protein AKJ52_00325 [candidate division MSBL1 archaeon SCGC-AAA382C18]|uniref:Polymerase nucleotidyl transferase domain-containing protein n=1 Tax=candidate division MSBL1 archaeon SCGC-AAA382C18 TaxID=1698281 RepID=A0A133VLT6_9EURY|nr:hypothetical protein AKJ52_00325 [candidate division MSBL1 archaeon SCGC-AAA382C18]
MRNYRDKDYLESKEGFMFCVVGSVHPEDRLISYLKYIPSEDGKWRGEEKNYKRIMRRYTMSNLKNTIQFLEDYPKYILDSSSLDVKISAVPISEIKTHHKPEEKLEQISEMENPDSLQQKSLDLAHAISEKSKVSLESIGVTGSILLDIHQPFSDIDLVVYGGENSRKVRKAINDLYKEEDNHFDRFDSEEISEWCTEKSSQFPISPEEAKIIYERKWGRGIFKNKMFSIYPIKKDREVSINYGDRIYHSEGLVKIRAIVSDTTESLYIPSIYGLENVDVIEGEETYDIESVGSYEGFYRDIAREGEEIEVYGKLEKVIDKKKGGDFHQVLVGSFEASGEDYIKPVSP